MNIDTCPPDLLAAIPRGWAIKSDATLSLEHPIRAEQLESKTKEQKSKKNQSKMSSSSVAKRLLVLLVLVALVAALAQVQQVESCRRNRTEVARTTIANLLRLYPELISEITSTNSTSS